MVSYSALKPVEERIKGVEHVIHTIGIYSSYIDPFVQYISNAIDADASEVRVQIFQDRLPNRHSIIITDNGHGMTRDKLASIPSSIGESDKTYTIRRPGEHPKMGLHAFGEYAYQTWTSRESGQLTVISRPHGHDSYNVLVRRSTGPREGVIDSPEYGRFQNGTRVIVQNVRDDIMKLLQGANGERRVRENLSDIFDICLRKEHMKIYVRRGEGEFSPVHLVPSWEYKGEVILDESIPVEYVDELGQHKEGEVQFYILGSSEGAGRIRLCLQDARVLKNISDVEQLNHSPLNAPVLGGYVNSVDVLWPTGEKHAIQVDSNRFPPFYDVVNSRKDLLEEVVKRLSQERDVSRDATANELIQEIFKEDLALRLEGTTPKPRGRGKGKPKPRGHRTVKSPLTARLTQFPIQESDKLSKLDSDIVYINSGSGDYLGAVEGGARAEKRFLLGLLTGEYSFYKLRNVMQGGTVPTEDMIHTTQENAYKLFLRSSRKLGL